MRASSSLEDPESSFADIDLKPPLPNLVAVDLSTGPSCIFSKHQFQCATLIILVSLARLAMARSTGELDPVASLLHLSTT